MSTADNPSLVATWDDDRDDDGPPRAHVEVNGVVVADGLHRDLARRLSDGLNVALPDVVAPDWARLGNDAVRAYFEFAGVSGNAQSAEALVRLHRAMEELESALEKAKT